MTREDTVTVKTKDGGYMAFSHGRCSLILAAGQTADKWMDGSPITRGEFEDVLAPHAEMEIVQPAGAAAGRGARSAGKGVLPSAPDLDAVAEDQKARTLTSR